jgi:signal transduction histidine kinase
MSLSMPTEPLVPPHPMLSPERVRTALKLTAVMTLLLLLPWQSGFWALFWRVATVVSACMLAYGLFERWPRHLPHSIARWALQVVAVAVVIPPVVLAIYVFSTPAGEPDFWEVSERAEGFGLLTVTGLLVAPWVALSALFRHRDQVLREQALSFALERSELERQALDAQMRLLQAQIEPHFLFNTLANVRTLVASGAAQAPAVLDHLIEYLRAAVPRLNATEHAFEQELALVCAYLELMRMRMPDRLRFAIDIDPEVLQLQCPPMTVLTLVENAVRHGIDPSEEGGEIRVRAQRLGERYVVQVRDTGVGLRAGPGGLGTGLANLRERLRLGFQGEAGLHVEAAIPQGVIARLEMPARELRP